MGVPRAAAFLRIDGRLIAVLEVREGGDVFLVERVLRGILFLRGMGIEDLCAKIGVALASMISLRT